jgi:hypothetical protein
MTIVEETNLLGRKAVEELVLPLVLNEVKDDNSSLCCEVVNLAHMVV